MSLTLVLLTACITQPVPVIPAEDGSYRQILLERINLYRLENGLNPLQLDPFLSHLAWNHCVAMFAKGRANHRDIDERFAQIDSTLCVENIGWNYGSPLGVFEGWRKSRGHNKNLLKEGINRAGIAEVGKYVTFFACN